MWVVRDLFQLPYNLVLAFDAGRDEDRPAGTAAGQAAALPMMEQGCGKMSLTASFGLRGGIGPANNAASKAGVAGLTRTLALEVARHRVDVSCVARGATKTPMTATIPSHLEQRLVDRAPLKRMAKPKKIANAHLFLVSDESSYITGQCIFADGRSALGVQAPGGSCLSSEVYDEI